MTLLPEGLVAALADRYRFKSELGAGGMASVYLAEDTKHKRDVAFKVFRPELAATLGSGRFTQEIAVTARLQHPHILPLHDSGEAGGFLYYVMPYVEGKSLRQRIQECGELPIAEAVRILTQVAEAIAYAHRQGVVHRDLKPDNIMLSGRNAMVLDFGIARAVSVAGGSGIMTTVGAALGTPAYMAPEQVLAEPDIDHRVDLYAFGVMAYELLSGQPPFALMPAQQVVAAHLSQVPTPISTRRASVPAPLAAVVMQCLEKRPADRPQTADEMVGVLEGLGMSISGAPAPLVSRWVSPETRRRRVRIAGVVGFVALSIAAVAWWLASTLARAGPVQFTQLTFTGGARYGEISPDGQLLAYAEGFNGARLMVKDLASGSTIQILRIGQPTRPVVRWTSKGDSLLYVGRDSTGKPMIALFPRLGGAPRLLPRAEAVTYATLSPDRGQLAMWGESGKHPLVFVTLATGARHNIVSADSQSVFLDGGWSPDGRMLAIARAAGTLKRSQLSVFDVKSGAERSLIPDSVPLLSPNWSWNGRAIYYVRGGNELWKLDVASDGNARRAPVMLQRLGKTADYMRVAADNRRLVFTATLSTTNLVAATKSEGQPFVRRALTSGTAPTSAGGFSPDGTQLAFIRTEGERSDVYIVDDSGGGTRRVTASGVAFNPGVSGSPAWSPDGKRLAFLATVGGVTRVRTVNTDGQDEREYAKAVANANVAWAPYQRILYQRESRRGLNWLNAVNEEEEALIESDTLGAIWNPIPSPDGSNIAVFLTKPDARGVYVISPQTKSIRGPLAGLSDLVGWSADGRHVFGVGPDEFELRRVPLGGGAYTRLGSPGSSGCFVRDRKHRTLFVCVQYVANSDSWMIDNFDPRVAPLRRR
ncbi:MAG: protein kinase [Gemmatimonas sp.]